jgi:spermidine/putrescine transport system ATP-binding protein
VTVRAPAHATGGVTTTPAVEVRRLVKEFGDRRGGVVRAVDDVSLAIREGEFFALLGPSGCGKTTTLRAIAGFEEPSSGEILLRGRPVQGVPPFHRPVNTVFQDYALFPHMSVRQNVMFGLRMSRVAPPEARRRADAALELVHLPGVADRRPAQLSGGQQQRVALARALVNRPAVLLLDEPLGALDQKLRKQMQVELANLHRQLGITFIMVTHDQEEALALSDRIAVMNNGQIEQIGTPGDIYDRPRTPFVADFIGDTNLLPGRLHQVSATEVQVIAHSGLQVIARAAESVQNSPGQEVVVSVRPEKISLSPSAPASSGNCYQGEVRHLMYLGTHLHCVVQLTSGETLAVHQPNRAEATIAVDMPVYIQWAIEDCLVLKVV